MENAQIVQNIEINATYNYEPSLGFIFLRVGVSILKLLAFIFVYFVSL